MPIELKNTSTASIEEIENEIKRLSAEQEQYHNLEQALKIQLNSTYGAMASPFFYGYNTNIAEAITQQGQNLAKFASKCIDNYFMNVWPNDHYVHKQMGLTKIDPIVKDTLTVYMDTDSVDKDTLITLVNDNNTTDIKISDLYDRCYKELGSAGNTVMGHESALFDPLKLGYLYNLDEKGIYISKPARIIRHKVSHKPKWKLRTKSGKEVLVTGDHSMIVYRDGKQMVVKPRDIKPTDKIAVKKF